MKTMHFVLPPSMLPRKKQEAVLTPVPEPAVTATSPSPRPPDFDTPPPVHTVPEADERAVRGVAVWKDQRGDL